LGVWPKLGLLVAKEGGGIAPGRTQSDLVKPNQARSRQPES
jgi:hypothetical protein